jgi:16S rRNA (guanine(1405)-N(7))-methyltransferase
MSADARLEELVARVCGATKYGTIDRGLVARIALEELAAGRSVKEATKTTRRRLHQIGAVYIQGAPHYGRWLELLREATGSGDAEQIKAACRAIMATHQSSLERLPILDVLYRDVLAGFGPVNSVLDLACGLNPLAIPWMPLAPGAHYRARDIFGDMMTFLAKALPLLNVDGDAGSSDALTDAPGPPVQVTFLLKSVPCLEQIDRGAGERLVASAPSRYVVVSFPTASLGGRRDRGMLATYRARMAQICEGRGWTAREHLYDTELAYHVDKADFASCRENE